MIRKILTIVAMSAFTLGYSADMKIGVFDLSEAMRNTKVAKRESKKLEAELKKAQKEIEAEAKKLSKMEKTLKSEADAYRKKASLMSKSAREVKERAMQEKFSMHFKDGQRHRAKRGQLEMSFKQKEAKAVAPIIEKLKDLVESYGKAKKFDFIAERNVVYFNSKDVVDVTDALTKEFDKKNK